MSSTQNDASESDDKLKRKEYERELARLHVELVKLQLWVVHQGLKICILEAILNIAGSGKFSSDRTIALYAAEIWNAKPCPVP